MADTKLMEDYDVTVRWPSGDMAARVTFIGDQPSSQENAEHLANIALLEIVIGRLHAAGKRRASYQALEALCELKRSETMPFDTAPLSAGSPYQPKDGAN